MGKHVSIDIETYSDVDIGRAGLYRYAQSPAFDILLIAWTEDAGPVRIIDLTLDPGAKGSGANWQSLSDFLAALQRDDVTLHAYNAAFEHYCLNTWLRRQGRPEIPLGRFRCTMAHGLYCGYGAGLAAVGEALGLPQDKKKLSIGGALIRRFCVPRNEKPLPLLDEVLTEEPTLKKVRRWIQAEPEKWELFKTYCQQDVEAERAIETRLSRWPMPEREQKLWELTTEANIVGVGVDRELVTSAIAIGEKEQEHMIEEAREISGLQNPKSVQQLMTWLNKALDTNAETEITDLRKATVADMLETLREGDDEDHPSVGCADSPPQGGLRTGGAGQAEAARRMLELRQLMSKTSTKKYDALEAAVCNDDRVRGMMFYYGASRTGRWAGRIVQPQNLPQNHLDSLAFARDCVKDLDIEMLKLSFGSVPDTLSQLIRTAFVPAPGKIYAIADYSAIEARVVAWLAGEQWVLDAFLAGKDIYCATASQMFDVPVEKHGQNAHLRQRGKVATLALGYGGGEGALEAMGALKMGIPEEDLTDIKQRWRQANPAICRFWRVCEDAALAAVGEGKRQAVHVGGGNKLRVVNARERWHKYRVYRVTDYMVNDGTIQKRRELAGETWAVSPDKARVNVEYRTRGKALYGGSEFKDIGYDEGVETYYEAEEIACDPELMPPDVAKVELLPDIVFALETDQATDQKFLTIELPTGRKLFYAHPYLEQAKNFPDRQSLHYYSVNQTSHKWTSTDTWGGKLVENITQAVARDCLAETLLRLQARGLTAVFHVHDEVIVEVDREDQLQDILGIMAEPLPWAPGLPLKGAGFCAAYYQKD